MPYYLHRIITIYVSMDFWQTALQKGWIHPYSHPQNTPEVFQSLPNCLIKDGVPWKCIEKKKWKRIGPLYLLIDLSFAFFSMGVIILLIVLFKFFVGISFTFLYRVELTLEQYSFELCRAIYMWNFSVNTVQYCKWIFYSLWFSY